MESNARPLTPLLAAVRGLVDWLDAEDAPGMIIGGLAASVLGSPRVTRDVDAVVLLNENRWQAFLVAGAPYGFVARLSDAIAFAHRARVLLVRHQPTGIDVDVILGALPFEEEAISRAREVTVAGITFRLPTPEDLIIMKAVAHRSRDLADIAAILDTQARVDLRRVRRWVREFAAATDRPEILDDLEAILKRRRRHPN